MLRSIQLDFLHLVCPNRWTEENGIINVDGYVNMDNMNLTKIPVQFGQVTGYFNCSNNQLTTLEGVPEKIGGYFNCDNNALCNLINGPKIVNFFYSCSNNTLTNLIGISKKFIKEIYCQENKLTSLEGCPTHLKYLNCKDNPDLHIIYGIGKIDNFLTNINDSELNYTIFSKASQNIFMTDKDIAQWIIQNKKYTELILAPQIIRRHFSPRVLYNVDMGVLI